MSDLLTVARAHAAVPLALLVSRPDNWRALTAAPSVFSELKQRLRMAYDAEAIFAQREAGRRALFADQTPWSFEEALAGEVAEAAKADVVVAVSEADAEVFRTGGVKHVRVVGHSAEILPTETPFADRRDLLFVGRLDGSRQRSPNVDSLVWFAEEVLPRLQKQLAAPIRLHVVGARRSADVEALSSPALVLHGQVASLDSFYESCRVFIAPTRFSAGMPMKLHEAASRGIPCVATPTVTRQAGLEQDGAVLTAHSAEDFAAACAALYTHQELWARTRASALQQIQRLCSPSGFEHQIQSALTLLQELPRSAESQTCRTKPPRYVNG